MRARTGKIALRKYLHHIGKAESPTCQLCGLEDQTVKHLLLSCANLSDLRKEVWPEGQPSDRKTLLTDTEHTERCARFLFQTGLLGQFKEAMTHLIV
jgi:hypothetical protein